MKDNNALFKNSLGDWVSLDFDPKDKTVSISVSDWVTLSFLLTPEQATVARNFLNAAYPLEQNQVKLWYGFGFAGVSYKLEINGQFTKLGPPEEYTEESIARAKQKAKEVLETKGIDCDIDIIPFEFDGCL